MITRYYAFDGTPFCSAKECRKYEMDKRVEALKELGLVRRKTVMTANGEFEIDPFTNEFGSIDLEKAIENADKRIEYMNEKEKKNNERV